MKDGFGKLNYENGDVYEGNFKFDMKNGEGTLIYANGDLY
tara:strand:- start:469 stop:588 length:120 start_codon:yes stop_codon:yes gene_type:complete